MNQKSALFILFIYSLFSVSCKFQVKSSGTTIAIFKLSGIVTPFVGKISHNSTNSYLIQSANAAYCHNEVIVKLFKIKNNGVIDESSPLAVKTLGSDARYEFPITGLSNVGGTVDYLIKAEGCDGEVYKRPVTDFNSKQNIDAKTSVISEVINANSLVTTTLNEASKERVQALIDSLEGTSISSALNSLQTDANSIAKFKAIFGVSPDVIQNAKPEVMVFALTTNLEEMTPSIFSINTFHPDPTYTFAYSWKLDGVIESTNPNWNYIPSANSSGKHQVDLFVGKRNASGLIDITKPYFIKTFNIVINNNIKSTPPNISLNALNLSYVNSASVLIDIATGVDFGNCTSFSRLAFTDTPTPPEAIQFNRGCSVAGSQTENVTFSNGDGLRNIFIWAIDNEGNISTPKSLSLVLDSHPPIATLTFSPGIIKGGSIQTISLSADDIGSGMSSLSLRYSTTGGAPYNFISNLTTTSKNYSWNTPSIDSANTILQLIATDLTGQQTIIYSPSFAIDSLAPSAPILSLTSPAYSNSLTVNISTICSADYEKILYSESSSTPLLNNTSWENCSATKNFTLAPIDGNKNIYAFTKDIAGNISTSANVSMVLNRIAPAAPIATLHSPAISISTGISSTMSDCLNRPYIFIGESITPPTASDPKWITCSTASGAISHNLIGPAIQGNHNLYLFAKDSAGNISLPSLFSMIYDTTKPTLSLSTTIASFYRGTQTLDLNFSASDDYGVATIKLEYAVDGVNFQSVATLAATATTYSWTIPSDNTNIAKIRIIATDNSQATPNKQIITSPSFTIDSQSPSAPTLTRTSLAYSPSANVTMSINSCTDISYIYISELNTLPLENESGWEACSTAPGAYTKAVIEEGNHILYAWAKDIAGNVSNTANSISMTLDSIDPSIVAGPVTSPFFVGGSAQSITWTVTDATTTTIKLELFNGSNWSILATGLPNNGAYNWTTVPMLNISNAKIRLTALDSAGNTSTTESTELAIDSSPPQIDSLSINSGSLFVANNNVIVSLTAHDTLLKIKYFCLKYDDSIKPTLNSSCWKNVSAPSPGIAAEKDTTFSNYYFQIGFTKGLSTIYAWVKDEADQISNNTAEINVDSYSVTFDPGSPPKLTNVVVSNSDSPNNPIKNEDIIIPSSSSMYIKWHAEDTEGLTPRPIDLNYTTDNIVYNPVTNGLNLLNGVNGDCTIGIGFTGCAKLPSISNGYYKIRIIAKDSLGTTVFTNSSQINESKLKIIAGNTEDGLNGSASTAIFLTYENPGASSYTKRNRLVVSDDGKFFYIDPERGLLWIDPSDGVLKSFIKTTGTSTGEGKIASLATLKEASAITLDFTNHLLIWDFNEVRKVNLSTMIITKIIGGGAQTDPLVTVNASNISLPIFDKLKGTFISLPNGDIIFGNSSLHYRRFRAIDNKLELINLVGEGFTNYHTDEWAATTKESLAVAFNSADSTLNFMMKGFRKSFTGDSWILYAAINFSTGSETTPYTGISSYEFPFSRSNAFSGLDGNIYIVDRYRSLLMKYNYETNTTTNILGNLGKGSKPCTEKLVNGFKLLATECEVSIDSFFVTKNGRIYFMDNGEIRTIDDNNNVITLFGQFPSYGHNVLATDARFGTILDFKMGKITPNNNKIIIQDSYSQEYGQLTNGGTVNKLFYLPKTIKRFETDPLTGDIFTATSSTGIGRYVRATNTLNTIIGGGSKYYYDASSIGLAGTQMRKFSYTGQILGYINNKLLHHTNVFSAVSIQCLIRTYDVDVDVNALYKLGPFMGDSTCASNSINTSKNLNAQILSTANISNVEYFSDPNDSLINKYFFTKTSDTKIYSATENGNVTQFANLGTTQIYAFTHRFNTEGILNIYYCGNNGKLYEYSNATKSAIELPWLSPNFKCEETSRTIIYNSERNSIIFSFIKNGLSGIAEYSLD